MQCNYNPVFSLKGDGEALLFTDQNPSKCVSTTSIEEGTLKTLTKISCDCITIGAKTCNYVVSIPKNT